MVNQSGFQKMETELDMLYFQVRHTLKILEVLELRGIDLKDGFRIKEKYKSRLLDGYGDIE